MTFALEVWLCQVHAVFGLESLVQFCVAGIGKNACRVLSKLSVIAARCGKITMAKARARRTWKGGDGPISLEDLKKALVMTDGRRRIAPGWVCHTDSA